MNFWIREFVGWLLVSLGLFVFYRSYLLLTGPNHYILEGGALTLIGIVLFRGGIHLLKIAVAARICMDAEERLREGESDLVAGAARWQPRRASGLRR
jgi:hypothetical protein